MIRRRGDLGAASFFVLAILAALGLAASAQAPILTFSIDGPIVLPIGGTAEVVVRIESRSVHDADDITVTWLAPEALAPAEAPEPIKLLSPFDIGQIRFRISAPADAEVGETTGRLAVSYSYCVYEGIEERCYRFDEELDVALRLEAPVVPVNGQDPIPDPVEPTPAGTPFPWPWVGLALSLLLVAGLLVLGRRPERADAARIGLALIVVGGLVFGVARSQHEQAQGIGAVLCTSCVGIEEAGPKTATLSEGAIEALATLDEDVELTVFYAVWCHSCPYAESMVERMAEVNDRIRYRFVDVEVNPELAEAFGVIRSGRTVVPAIVRSGSDEVLFGSEDLERRLLDLLLGTGEVSP